MFYKENSIMHGNKSSLHLDRGLDVTRKERSAIFYLFFNEDPIFQDPEKYKWGDSLCYLLSIKCDM